ncbi:MAG TPA: SpoIID/LytB domain-containing protein [Prevotella sp.]
MIATENEPQVAVGIVSGERIEFVLNGNYAVRGNIYTGNQTVQMSAGQLLWGGNTYAELLFEPVAEQVSFSLKDVTIGVNFHWERKETQTFPGTLRLLANGGKVLAINRLPVERYLESVISSEMSATSSLQLLKAHAVISRSWLLAQLDKSKKVVGKAPAFVMNENEIIKWYDREDHELFDVCADDHCQRYQGITKETSQNVAQAVAETRGEILASDGQICDARFSKCCGGLTEEFEYCWEDAPKNYLKVLADTENGSVPDLTIEAAAEEWIRNTPEAFCNTGDKRVLSQVLNDYDQETADFYRWRVSYTQEQLSALIAKKINMDFGSIIDLVPVARGRSGRLYKLKIVGTKRTLTIGKELEIRRALSETHLYSSAFVVDKQEDVNGIPQRFDLIGAGWGHGVGLCQIGAAMMGEKGYSYNEILMHYYPGAEIKKTY